MISVDKKDAKFWIRKKGLQEVIRETAYGYTKTNDPKKYHSMLKDLQQYQKWYLTNYKETHKGLTLKDKRYMINLVTQDEEILFVEINQRGLLFRINLYPQTERYSLEVLEDAKNYQLLPLFI